MKNKDRRNLWTIDGRSHTFEGVSNAIKFSLQMPILPSSTTEKVFAMVWGLLESFVDNVVRDKVSEPAEGGVVYCDLAFGLAEHSGIYLGNGEIMHRDKDGRICCVSPKEFVAGTPAISIYTSCFGTHPAGDPLATDRARFYEKKRNGAGYALLWRNCHIFASACITGDEENADTFLWMLKHTTKQWTSANSWRVWDL